MITEREQYYMFLEEIFNKYFSIKEQIVYHYTSPEALKEIIKSKTLWLSDIHYMNDKSEIEYTKTLLIKILANKENLNEDFLNVIINCLNIGENASKDIYIPRAFKRQHYVTSFSLSSDELSLWNYYTKNDQKGGYNIGFNIKKMLNKFELLKYGKIIDGKIIYKESEQQRIINLLLDKFNERYNESEDSLSQDMLIEGFMSFINILSLFFKSEVFAAEKEYRIIFTDYTSRNHSTKSQNYKREYRILNGTFIPYVQQDFSSNDIESITASPLIDFSLSSGLNSFLRDNDIKIEVTKSKIPLRY